MSPLVKFYHHVKSDTFLRNNAIFFVGSLFIAFLNYLYYPVMSRVMSVEQFGEIQTIFSLVYLSGVVLPFVLNLIFNILFTPLQFGLKNNLLASIDIILILLTLIWAMVAIYSYVHWVSYIQIPYLLWVSFATVLQITITYLNR